MQVCKSIEKVEGGYIVEIRFPFANYSDGLKRVFITWAEVVTLLSKSADEPRSTAEPSLAASGPAGEPAARDHAAEFMRDAFETSRSPDSAERGQTWYWEDAPIASVDYETGIEVVTNGAVSFRVAHPDGDNMARFLNALEARAARATKEGARA